ncbi:MAG: SpoIID/LytB domain-containing protein [Eubacteriales bacterium]|nr:SpoIID/LytB domain-containing protein [Eubacteriales bacterium]
MKKSWILTMALLLSALFLQSCTSSADTAVPEVTPNGAQTKAVAWPKDQLDSGESGVPTLDVYVVDQQKVESVDVETYVQGVLAGEMKNTWPIEALKAQAILARTFVLKFVDEKESKYEGADISTDIEEAQAYDANAVNDRVRQAVEETSGLVLSAKGELPYAWFHAHSGGVTERAVSGLGWNQAEPAYTAVTDSKEPESVADEKDAETLRQATAWEATFTKEEFAAACQKAGASIDGVNKLEITERGESGRAVTLSVDGASVSATELRIALGSTKMRSTLLTSLTVKDGMVYMAGKGYGHGVGMSQWGAYAMAEEGKTAEEIVKHYFQDVTIEKIW